MMGDNSIQAAKDSYAEQRRAELSARMLESIGLARLAPGQRISLDSLALHLRAKTEDIKAILPSIAETGLLSVHLSAAQQTDVVIAELDRTALLARLEEREMLETEIAAAAAINATADQRTALQSTALLLKRSALVGDMEGYMTADRALEKIIGHSSQRADSFEKLVQIKREFRRAWCAHNRLRDLNIPAAMRETLTKAIVDGHPDAAILAVKNFMKYIRTCL
jgi:DNA-binding GntR family transcriptional regulator